MDDKPQRTHIRAVSRLGGIGVFSGFFAAFVIVNGSLAVGCQILICATPVFLVGFVEDLTGRVRPRWRLGVACMAALAGVLWFGAVLSLPFGASWRGGHTVLSIVFTVFCVAGVTQSFNIIDGFNGLLLGYALLSLAVFGSVAFQVADLTLLSTIIIMEGSLFGLFLFNFPKSKALNSSHSV